MTQFAHRRARSAQAALLVLCVLVTFAWTAPAFAGDDEPPPAAGDQAQETPKKGLDAESLEKRLLERPLTAAALVLFRFLPVAVGVLLMILWYLKRDKIKGGLLPPPPTRKPTRPFGVGMAIALVMLAMVFVPFVVLLFVANHLGIPLERIETVPIWGQVLAGAMGAIPVAMYVVYRRLTLVPSAPGAAQPPPLHTGVWTPDRGEAGTQPPRHVRAFGLGWWTLCVASLLVLPVTLGWALLLDGFGIAPQTQDLVQRVVEPSAPPHDAWIIAAFGVLIAPFVEESIFRGMLYPAAKRAFGGGRRAMWGAAVVVSLIFAAIHASWFALLPLFALALVLTWVFETTNSLAAVVFAHALHNLFSLVPLLMLRFLP